MQTPAWLDAFPDLRSIKDPAWQAAAHQSQLIEVPAGAAVFRDGDHCQAYLLVIRGVVRVQKVSESGKEIVLYRVEDGQSCVLTTSCLLSHDPYQAEAVTETPVQAVAIPAPAFQQALAESSGFRNFVFASYGQRITGLLMLIDAVAFGRMDARLAQRLLELADSDQTTRATHQALARELGTAREVVSRLLKDFERRHWVQLQRGQVVIRDREALQALAIQFS